jgi:membrane peptidoglycan carboxypeptidase
MGFKLIAAGKTGTTNDKRDAWFIGFTPKTLTLTWLGFDDNQPTGLSGGTGAVPIWTRYMQAVTAGQPNTDFASPDGIAMAQIDETSGGLAVPACPQRSVVNEAFKSGTQPMNPCPLHSPQAPPAPALDQFGNPIALDTAGMSVSPEVTTTAFPTLPPLPPLPSESGDNTLGGGIFKTDTAAPPPTTTSTSGEPPRRDQINPNREPNRERSVQPPPTTTTAEPPPTDTDKPPATDTNKPPR